MSVVALYHNAGLKCKAYHVLFSYKHERNEYADFLNSEANGQAFNVYTKTTLRNVYRF